MFSDDITFDYLRQRAALDLSPQQQAEFQRLVKVLRFGSKFQMIFVETGNAAMRDRLIARLSDILGPAHVRCARLDLDTSGLADIGTLEHALRNHHQASVEVIHIINIENWLDDARLHGLNLRREALAHDLACKLVFWASPAMLNKIALHAADLWSWRSGVYAFIEQDENWSPALLPASFESLSPADNSTLSDCAKRISTLRQVLPAITDDETRAPLLNELASLLAHMGSTSEALQLRLDQEIPTYRRLGMKREEGIAYCRAANVLTNQSAYGPALEYLENHALPIFRFLGDERLIGQAQLDIAFIWLVTGKIGEAYTLCHDVILPAARRLKDKPLKARTHTRIAEALFARREYANALTILRSKAMPLWRELHSLPDMAKCYGEMAMIFQRLGRLDEALDLRLTKELPIYLQLENAAEAARCKGEISVIFIRQGKFLEARKLLEEEVLPVVRQSNDQRSIAVIYGRLASIHATEGNYEVALALMEQECLPVFQRLADRHGLAVHLAFTASIRLRLGQTDAALEMLAQAQREYSLLAEPLGSEGAANISNMMNLLRDQAGSALNPNDR